MECVVVAEQIVLRSVLLQVDARDRRDDIADFDARRGGARVLGNARYARVVSRRSPAGRERFARNIHFDAEFRFAGDISVVFDERVDALDGLGDRDRHAFTLDDVAVFVEIRLGVDYADEFALRVEYAAAGVAAVDRGRYEEYVLILDRDVRRRYVRRVVLRAEDAVGDRQAVPVRIAYI